MTEFRDALIVQAHDGDTVTAEIDYPYCDYEKVVKTQHVRLRGIQAAEIDSKDAAVREKAMDARTFLSNKVLGKRVRLQIFGNDKYGGRIDANIFLGGENVNDSMIVSGHAVQWNGVGQKPIG